MLHVLAVLPVAAYIHKHPDRLRIHIFNYDPVLSAPQVELKRYELAQNRLAWIPLITT